MGFNSLERRQTESWPQKVDSLKAGTFNETVTATDQTVIHEKMGERSQITHTKTATR